MQEPKLEIFLELVAVFFLVFLLTPFTRPSLCESLYIVGGMQLKRAPLKAVLFLTYFIPVIPFIMVFDGFISAYRTRSLDHIQHLSNLASLTLNLEGHDNVPDWRWEEGRRRHTWPSGTMYWAIGRRESDPGSI